MCANSYVERRANFIKNRKEPSSDFFAKFLRHVLQYRSLDGIIPNFIQKVQDRTSVPLVDIFLKLVFCINLCIDAKILQKNYFHNH